jgi:uncharacterized Zn finger protein
MKRSEVETVKASYADLTWDDLESWAGARVVARGKSYLGSVSDLRRMADNRLLAWVQGSERYATEVRISDAGKPTSTCTCPYGVACKHAVATILAYLDAVEAKRDVPLAEPDDERAALLADEAWDAKAENDENDAEDERAAASAPQAGKSAAKKKIAAPSEVDACLARLGKKDLLKLLATLQAEVPEVGRRLREQAELAVADRDRLIASARRAIREASAKPGWTRHWSGESYIPDYSPVRKRLQALLDASRADDVVSLGGDLLKAGLRQMSQSDDEGETGEQVAESMGIVFQALAVSSMPDVDKLLWEADARLREDYGFFESLPDLWSEPERFSHETWSQVADALAARMESSPQTNQDDSSDAFPDHYLRDKIRRRRVAALAAAGRAGEISDLLAHEAKITNCYVELVDHLLSLDRVEEAERWCRKGFAATENSFRGIAFKLRERLRDIARRRGDLPLVAAFEANRFLDDPRISAYQTLKEAAEPLGLWTPVRRQMLAWLETGVRPDAAGSAAPAAKTKRAKAAENVAEDAPWPLPDTVLHLAGEQGRGRSFPQTELLIQIAIEEKRHDDAITWYERHKARRSGGWSYFGRYGLEASLAEAVCETHPDAALGIWRTLAEYEIAQTKPAAYEAAGEHLERMKAVYARTGRMEAWAGLLDELRAKNRLKRCLMAVLDRLEGKPKDRRTIRSR